MAASPVGVATSVSTPMGESVRAYQTSAHAHMMPHVATDSALGVRWDLTRVFADGDAARRALADLDAAAAALQPPGDDVAEIRAALDAHDDVVRVAEALHDEWGYAALRLSADVDDVEARDS